jgi:hypothetical protein
MWPPIGLSSNLCRRDEPGGSAIVNLEGSGKLQLKDLLSHQSLVLPPH